MIISVAMMTSCLGTEEGIKSPECYITSFSVGDITTGVTVHKADGTDTIINKVISGSNIHFNIDQTKGIISSVDSLPSWANTTRVVPSFSAIGTVYHKTIINGEEYVMALKSGSDSLDLDNPIDLLVAASDGVSKKLYKVYLNKTSNNADTVVWKANKMNIALPHDFKALTLNNRVFAFYEGEDGSVMTTNASASTNLTSWSEPAKLNGAEIDPKSVIVYNDAFYALGNDGCIYKADGQNRPETWSKTSDKTFERLLAADKYYIYAFDGNEILGTCNFEEWLPSGKHNVDMLPTECVQSFAYKSKSNPEIQYCVMTGLSDNNKKNGISWYKVSSDKEDVNQEWMYIQITKDNKYAMPKWGNMSVTLHNGKLLAIGTEGEEPEYSCIYISEDNGITWHEQSDKYPVPVNLDAAKGPATMLSLDGKIWIIQNGGNVWSGTIK